MRFVDTPRTRIELSTTHPGGLPQFITGKSTLLSSLIRDELALRNARLAAAEITQKGIELRSVRGIESVHLAIGLASWRNAGEEFLAPVLLRPLAIRRYGRDFELKLKGQPFLNPALARELREQFQITLDADAFVALAITNGVFKPQPVIDRLRGLTRHLPWFSVAPRLVVSSFAEVGPAMAADAAKLDHPVIDAIAGNPAARAPALASTRRARACRCAQDERPPSTDTLLLDADPEQEQVVAEIEAGHLARREDAAGHRRHPDDRERDRRARRQATSACSSSARAARASTASPTASGRSGSAAPPSRTAGLRRDLIQSISRNEKAEQPRVADVDDALVRLRKVLLDYRSALTRRDPELHVSVLDALGELARLALLAARRRRRRPGSTTPSLVALADRPRPRRARPRPRRRARRVPLRPGRLALVRRVVHLVRRGHRRARAREATERHRAAAAPRARPGADRADPAARRSSRSPSSACSCGSSSTSARRSTGSSPSVFDRPLGELIAATSSRRDSPGMSGANRRRLRRLALEYVRPGVHVTDLNAALRGIQQQRTLWQRYSEAGRDPRRAGRHRRRARRVPARSRTTSRALDAPLGVAGTPRQLAARPVRELIATLAGLAAESEVLAEPAGAHRAARRGCATSASTRCCSTSRERHVPEHGVAAELELAWWQSVLESMLADDKALLGANTHGARPARGRLPPRRRGARLGRRTAARVAARRELEGRARRPPRRGRPAEADAPRRPRARRDAARRRRRTSSACSRRSGSRRRTRSPAIDDEIRFDTVILVDAGATTIAENLGAIRRAQAGRRVRRPRHPDADALRDRHRRRRAMPSRRSTEHGVDALHADSALARLGELLPTLTLTRSYRAGGEDLAELVNRRFYAGRIESLPWAGSFLGHGSLGLHYVRGNGLPDAGHRHGRERSTPRSRRSSSSSWSTPSSARASRSW